MWNEDDFLQRKVAATPSELKVIRLNVYEDTVRSVLSDGYMTKEKEYISFDFSNCKSILYDEHLIPFKARYNKHTQIEVVQNDCLRESLTQV